MLPKEIYEQAHKEFPFATNYPNKPKQCYHDFSFVVYCNNKIDIVRCMKCGCEKEVPCSFNDECD